MPPRFEVSSLRLTVDFFIVEKIKDFKLNHGTHCTFCKGIGKYSSLQKRLWETHFEILGMNVTFDCPSIIKAVDQIVSYIPTYEMKTQISNYLSQVECIIHSVVYKIMRLLEHYSSRGIFTTKIKDLVRKFGLLAFRCDPILALEELKHFLPLARNLTTLDLKSVEPKETILELIGKECNFLRKILNLQILKCSSIGLKKMLFSDSRHTVRRNICTSLVYVFTVFEDWKKLDKEGRVKVCVLWYLILKNCPNISMMQEDFNCAEVYGAIKECAFYVHDKFSKFRFSDNSMGVRLSTLTVLYTRTTHLKFHFGFNMHACLPNFECVSCFHFEGFYKDVKYFLQVRGKKLLDFHFVSVQEEPLDLNEISFFCPCLIKLLLACCHYAFTYKAITLRNLERLTICYNTNPDVLWLVHLLASLPELKCFIADETIGNFLTRDWIDAGISCSSFLQFTMLLVSKCPLLKADDVSKWVSSCPQLRVLAYRSEGYPQITENEWKTLKSSIANQNYHFIFFEIKH